MGEKGEEMELEKKERRNKKNKKDSEEIRKGKIETEKYKKKAKEKTNIITEKKRLERTKKFQKERTEKGKPEKERPEEGKRYKRKRGIYERYIKRVLDVVCAIFGLVALSPVMLVVAVLVRVKLGSPVIFTQERPGKDEKIFKLYKFRSMSDQRDKDGKLLPDEERLGRFGKSLRATSLDELPELVNILKGDMSVVGPRPLLVRDMVFMTQKQRYRYAIRQGLTGLAQINGRNAIDWEKKLAYDIRYVKNIYFWEDIRIICETVRSVIRKDGITEEGAATAEDYGDYLLHQKKVDIQEYEKKQKEAKEILDGMKGEYFERQRRNAKFYRK